MPLRYVNVNECAKAFLLHLVERFGSPTQMTTDRGRQFVSYIWMEMCVSSLGLSCHTPRRITPQKMGWLNVFIVLLKQLLSVTIIPQLGTKISALFLFGVRSMVKEDICCSSFELALGTTLSLPGQFFSDNDEMASHTEYRR